MLTIVAKGHAEGTTDGAVDMLEKTDCHAKITHNKMNETDYSTNESIPHLKTDINRTLHIPSKSNAEDHPSDRVEEAGSESEMRGTEPAHVNHAEDNA